MFNIQVLFGNLIMAEEFKNTLPEARQQRKDYLKQYGNFKSYQVCIFKSEKFKKNELSKQAVI